MICNTMMGIFYLQDNGNDNITRYSKKKSELWEKSQLPFYLFILQQKQKVELPDLK